MTTVQGAPTFGALVRQHWLAAGLTQAALAERAGTIAATRTDGGLRVEATLDSGDYPTGIAVSKERLQALPLERHATHGAWNYSLHPQDISGSTGSATVGEADGPTQRRQAILGKLADERLTGMSTTHLEQLAVRLAPAQAARTQQRYSEQRGGRARRASGKIRHTPLFDDAARLLLTLLYQRQVCSMNVLAELLEVTATCIASYIKETREVLDDHRYDPGVASIRFPHRRRAPHLPRQRCAPSSHRHHRAALRPSPDWTEDPHRVTSPHPAARRPASGSGRTLRPPTPRRPTSARCPRRHLPAEAQQC